MAGPEQTTGMPAPMSRVERAHKLYREGMHEEALAFYTEALVMARSKAQRIALHSNRAACYLKLHDFKKAAEECTSVLELDQQHTGALMLRVQTLVTLKDYQSALFDVNRLIEMSPSSDVYQNLQARLKTQLSLAPIPESDEEALVHEEDGDDGEEERERETDGESKGEQKKIGEKPSQISGSLDTEVQRQVRILESQTTQAQKPSRVLEYQTAQTQKPNKIPESQATRAQKPSRIPEYQTTQTQKPRRISESPVTQAQSTANPSNERSKGWETIPKPKGHSGLDYSRWDKVEDDSSEDEEEEDDDEPQYRFRVRAVGI
ncbi:unnamed protein product [Spirodela intermedia]|uniref:Uncharacterized protein n=1 Tax=Spirodela intermedia TaxID=51605 RepID=A0A7I8LAP8_SPIIN|nr:unnamed protein product [Spirodela intermedia]